MTKQDELLWESRGMAHHISLTEVSAERGLALIAVTDMPGRTPTMATLTREDRFQLAKALYPEAFDGDAQPLREEYGVQDRNGRMEREHAYLNKHLAYLVGFAEDSRLMVRDVGNWRVAPEDTDD